MSAVAPRKRPRQQRSQRTVDAVLEAAAQVLEARGLGGFNTNAVADRAGVSIGSLYQYFPGKEAVIAALNRREGERFDRALSQALSAAAREPMAEAVAILVRAAVDHQTARPNLARILDLEERRLGLEADAAAAARRAVDRLASFLADRNVSNPAEAAGDLLHLAQGMIDGALDAPPASLTRRITRAALGYLTLDA